MPPLCLGHRAESGTGQPCVEASEAVGGRGADGVAQAETAPAASQHDRAVACGKRENCAWVCDGNTCFR